jgi:hypothetical protein
MPADSRAQLPYFRDEFVSREFFKIFVHTLQCAKRVEDL